MIATPQLPKILAIRPHRRCALAAPFLAALALAGCASSARLPVSAGTGAHPALPAPDRAPIPLVHVVDAKGRPVGVAIDKLGALLVADDVANTVWRVISSKAAAQ